VSVGLVSVVVVGGGAVVRVGGFVGRDEALACLGEELVGAGVGSRLVWVVGESGIGKTALLRRQRCPQGRPLAARCSTRAALRASAARSVLARGRATWATGGYACGGRRPVKKPLPLARTVMTGDVRMWSTSNPCGASEGWLQRPVDQYSLRREIASSLVIPMRSRRVSPTPPMSSSTTSTGMASSSPSGASSGMRAGATPSRSQAQNSVAVTSSWPRRMCGHIRGPYVVLSGGREMRVRPGGPIRRRAAGGASAGCRRRRGSRP
jgi:hypothetical protein